jgi:glucan 1,3-beta-glucosidase
MIMSIILTALFLWVTSFFHAHHVHGLKSSDIGNTPIRGVNLGGWFILEEYLNADLLDGVDPPDQYHFDSTVYDAEAKLKDHWETYYTEDDFRDFANWGLNA